MKNLSQVTIYFTSDTGKLQYVVWSLPDLYRGSAKFVGIYMHLQVSGWYMKCRSNLVGQDDEILYIPKHTRDVSINEQIRYIIQIIICMYATKWYVKQNYKYYERNYSPLSYNISQLKFFMYINLNDIWHNYLFYQKLFWINYIKSYVIHKHACSKLTWHFNYT